MCTMRHSAALSAAYVGLLLPAAKPQLTTGLRCLFSDDDGKVTGADGARADDPGARAFHELKLLRCTIAGIFVCL